MIGKITPASLGSASDASGSTRRLIAYLLGPGKRNEHHDPRLIAGWDGDLTTAYNTRIAAVVQALGGAQQVAWSDPRAEVWQRLAAVAGEVGGDVSWLLDLADDSSTRLPLWHCSLVADPGDGDLSDEQWSAIAARVMHDTGLARYGDQDAVRWVAVRHGRNHARTPEPGESAAQFSARTGQAPAAGADHVHVVAVLVRPDGSRARASNDRWAVQGVCRWAEAQYDLTPGPAARRTTPGRGKDEAQAARGRSARWLSEREQVRADVSAAAARSWTSEQMMAVLREQGYQVELRHSTQDPAQVTGWKVGVPAKGAQRGPRWYTAKTIGKELSWPRLESKFQALRRAVDTTGIVGEKEAAMLSVQRMTAAGWGAAMIDKVLDADRRLARGEDDPSLAYWLRDAFWQVAWEQEQCKGGPWTTAAHLYASIGGGGVPIDPIWDQKALDLLTGQINEHIEYVKQLSRANKSREHEGAQITADYQRLAQQRAQLARTGVAPPPARVPAPFSTRAHAAALVQHTPVVVAALSAMDRRDAQIRSIDEQMHQANARIHALNAQTDAANAEKRRVNEYLQGKDGQLGAFNKEGILHRRLQAALDARQEWRRQVGQLIDAAASDQSPDARDRVLAVTAAAQRRAAAASTAGARR